MIKMSAKLTGYGGGTNIHMVAAVNGTDSLGNKVKGVSTIHLIKKNDNTGIWLSGSKTELEELFTKALRAVRSRKRLVEYPLK